LLSDELELLLRRRRLRLLRLLRLLRRLLLRRLLRRLLLLLRRLGRLSLELEELTFARRLTLRLARDSSLLGPERSPERSRDDLLLLLRRRRRR